METNKNSAEAPNRRADLDTMWSRIHEGIQRVLDEPETPLSTKSYLRVYTAIYNYCTSNKTTHRAESKKAGPNLACEDAYNRLSKDLISHLDRLAKEAKTHADYSLLEFYAHHWARYSAASETLNRLFTYLNRYWVKPQRSQGKKSIYVLATFLWKDQILDPIQSNLSDALISQTTLHRFYMNDSDSIPPDVLDRVKPAKVVIDSLVALSIDGQSLARHNLDLPVYRVAFEDPFLASTKNYYRDEAEKILKERPFNEYMNKVDNWLRQEQDFANQYLHSSTSKPLISNCEHVLIRCHLQRFYDAFPFLLDAWRTLPPDERGNIQEAKVNMKRMYDLLSRLSNGTEALGVIFTEYVKNDIQDSIIAPRATVSEASDVETYRVKYADLVAWCFGGNKELEETVESAIHALDEQQKGGDES